MSKLIKYDLEARNSLQKGVDTVVNAVKITLGPKGRNVVLEREFASPLITNDGVTIAKEIDLCDPFENLGAALIKEVCSKTNDIAGDGTTTSALLAQSIITKGINALKNGANPVILKKGINKAVENVTQTLLTLSKPIINELEIKQIASISANDEDIGEIIGQAIQKVGKEGVITIEEGNALLTELKVVKGMQFDRGYSSPYMCTNNEKMTVEYNNPYYLITDKKIESLQQILPILEKCVEQNLKLVIFADDFEGEVLATIILNKMRGTFAVTCVKAPAFGDKRKEILQDLAILTGGKVISNDTGLDFNDLSMEFLGNSKQVIITKDTTTIIEGLGNKEEISQRINLLKEFYKTSQSEYEKEKLNERIAKLSEGVAIISVGGTTETEMKEKKMRLEDALSSTRSAIEEGIIIGGGSALLYCKPNLKKLIETLTSDEKLGAEIILNSLSEPLMQIAQNSGTNGSEILKELEKLNDTNFGYDALNNKIVNMLDSGIIDATKVTKSAICNASSIASILLTTECLVVENPKDKKSNLDNV